ncbi:MAG: histidine kinase [Lachnospiraceae bacterium]|nr:histidine kinase [Lachnospiraceae bacterium]
MQQILIKLFGKLKLKQKIWVFFSVILGFYLIGLVCIFYFIMCNQINEYAEENSKNNLITIGNNLASEIDKVNNFSRLLLTNEGILEYLYADKKDVNAYNHAVESIYSVQNAYPEACSVFVFRKDGEYLTVGTGVTKVDRDILNSEEWLRPINDRKGGYLLQVNGEGVFHTNYQHKMISLVRDINDMEKFQKQGLLAVNFPVTVLEETYADVADSKNKFCYVDANGTKLTTDKDLEIFDQIVIGEEEIGQQRERKLFNQKIYSYYKVPGTGLILESVQQVDLLDNISKEYIPILVYFTLFTVFAFFLIQAFIAYFITTPIHKMVEAMSYAKEGWLRRVSVKTGDDEIGQLKDSYNRMLLETNDLINQLLDKEKVIRKSEVEIIQQQIKPHFLYNTIEMIACMSLDSNREEVYNALETLGSFYRQFLSRGNDQVPVSTEMDIISNYLKLEKMRYGDIFDAEFHIEECCNEYMVPKLLLQPLVENSLYHGIRLKGEKGMIRIRIWKEEQRIYIEVYDTGVGMTEEQIAHIMTENSKSFGFKRTMERLQYHENRQDVFRIESKRGFYTKITLNMIIR